MTQYRGFYIDHIHFNSKAEIDTCIKEAAVREYKNSVKYFAKHGTLEASIYCDGRAKALHNAHGFSFEEIENFEIEALEEVA